MCVAALLESCMRELLYYDTKVGRFQIVQSSDGMFHPVFKGFSLGRYLVPHEAALNLAKGNVLPYPGNIDMSRLGIPAELDQWRYTKSQAGVWRAAAGFAGMLVQAATLLGIA